MNREEVFLLKSNPYGLDEDKISCLEHLASEYLIKWGYIAVIEGMPTQSIINFANGENNTSTSEFLKIRDEMLKRKFTDVSLIREEVAVTVKSATNAIEESQELRKIFTENMEKMLADGKEVLEEKIKLKESSIDKLKQELAESKETEASLQKKLKAAKESLAAANSKKSNEQAVPTPVHQEKQVPDTKEKISEPQPKGDLDTSKKSRLSFLFSKRSNIDPNKKFIENYIGSDTFTIEQREYFLECMEEGMEVEEIEKFAIASLPLEMMKRLSKVGDYNKN